MHMSAQLLFNGLVNNASGGICANPNFPRRKSRSMWSNNVDWVIEQLDICTDINSCSMTLFVAQTLGWMKKGTINDICVAFGRMDLVVGTLDFIIRPAGQGCW